MNGSRTPTPHSPSVCVPTHPATVRVVCKLESVRIVRNGHDLHQSPKREGLARQGQPLPPSLATTPGRTLLYPGESVGLGVGMEGGPHPTRDTIHSIG